MADAAADEQMSLRLMRADPAMFPKTKLVVKDPTHAVQRVLKRPFAAIPEVHDVHSTLITRNDSFTRTIQNSDVLGSAFNQFCKKHHDFCHRIKNLQMRKHRFDSTQRPTGRMVLFLRAFISTAIFTSTHRQGERDGHRAQDFLEYISEYKLLLLSMCADASDEVSMLMRFLDQGDYDMATLVAEIEQFVGRVSNLFVRGTCRTSGYCEHMIRTLQTSIAYVAKDGPKSLGGQTRMTEAVFQDALKEKGFGCDVSPRQCSIRNLCRRPFFE